MKSRIERTVGLLVVLLALAATFAACSGTTGTGSAETTGASGTMGEAGTTGAAGTSDRAGTTGSAGAAGTTGGGGTTGAGNTGGTCELEPSFFFQAGATPAIPGVKARRVSMETFCGGDQGVCPPTLEAARAEVVRSMSQAVAITVAGCGRHALEVLFGLGGWAWIYDDATSELIGAANHGDIPISGCGSISDSQAGEGPPLPEGTDPTLVGDHRKTCAGVTTGPF